MVKIINSECEKGNHEFIRVEITSNNADKKVGQVWFQCKHCGKWDDEYLDVPIVWEDAKSLGACKIKFLTNKFFLWQNHQKKTERLPAKTLKK